MATYNGEKYIQEQLDSFLIQTRLPDELIISDDCSTDKTLEICQTFAKRAPFEVKILKNTQNLGYAKNFENAMKNCGGNLIFLSDQDDVWFPEKIEKVLNIFSTNSAQLIVHDIEYCTQNLKPIGETKLKRSYMAVGTKILHTGMATALRSEFLKYCLPIPKNKYIAHDLWLSTCADLLNKKYILEEPLAYYRRHNNATSKDNMNYAKKTNKFYFFRLSLKNAFINNIERNIIINQEKINWLEDNKSKLITQSLLSENEYFYIKKKLLNNNEVNNQRLKIVSTKKRITRIIPALKLYIKGDYSYFNGIKSFIKDIFMKWT